MRPPMSYRLWPRQSQASATRNVSRNYKTRVSTASRVLSKKAEFPGVGNSNRDLARCPCGKNPIYEDFR
jgi:hypothetical protein